ncbi:MAG: DUF2277 domain-containing protein [Tepidiformaceae bacterium]
MCRSIKTLRGAEPPVTSAEVQAAALQYVRKISGYRAPSKANAEPFDAAVAAVAVATADLLGGLVPTPVRPIERSRRLSGRGGLGE